ncbi:Uncharacterised protein [Aggregatibacter aphrophilus]|uniref:PIN-like domain-containing protein n=1 Tax=Aggregatibacter aphrophilus TaxID=732 RepID=A0A336N9T0_AGGAP|nr:Uncharacterised protein [Aggregatibacter aphrophilus]
MKYAFIDYENIHSLDNLNLHLYERIFLFLGANQPTIQLSEKFNDELNFTLITIKNIAKNNLDFHIAYYLGKMDMQTDKILSFVSFQKITAIRESVSLFRINVTRENVFC